MTSVYYIFQCMSCYIMSGTASPNRDDAPRCCGGEYMIALRREVPDAATE